MNEIAICNKVKFIITANLLFFLSSIRLIHILSKICIFVRITLFRYCRIKMIIFVSVLFSQVNFPCFSGFYKNKLLSDIFAKATFFCALLKSWPQQSRGKKETLKSSGCPGISLCFSFRSFFYKHIQIPPRQNMRIFDNFGGAVFVHQPEPCLI